MLKPPEEHTTGSDSVPLGLVACCVGVEVPAAMYRREVSVCVDGHRRTQATGLPAIGCCFLFLSAATRHTDAWQRARVQAGSSTQSSDYRDAGSSTSSCESAPSSSCRSSCRRVPDLGLPLDGDTTLRRATNVVCFMPLPMGFLPAELDLAFEGIDA